MHLTWRPYIQKHHPGGSRCGTQGEDSNCGGAGSILCPELWVKASGVAAAVVEVKAVALIPPLAWEPSYAARAAQEMAKRQKKKKKYIQSILGFIK